MGEETMQEAIITSTVDLTSGGCNACGLVEDTVYTLAMNGVDIPLDGLTVAHLVSAVVARNGFKQELKMFNLFCRFGFSCHRSDPHPSFLLAAETLKLGTFDWNGFC